MSAEDIKFTENARMIVQLMNNANPGRCMMLKINTPFVVWLCKKMTEFFEKEQNMVEIIGRAYVIGDIHGQIEDLCQIMKDTYKTEDSKYVFLGDYVDRGQNSVEVIVFLFCCKLLFPERFTLLRGNHETRDMTNIHGFKSELGNKMSRKVWENFVECFDCMPIAAKINSEILCIHGGISPELHTIEQLNEIDRKMEIPKSGLLMDLLWADPEPTVDDFKKSIRGDTFFFGKNPLLKFLSENKLKMLIRGHQVVDNGFEYPFEPDHSCLTVFSAACYSEDSDNYAAYVDISVTNEIKEIKLPLFTSRKRFTRTIATKKRFQV